MAALEEVDRPYSASFESESSLEEEQEESLESEKAAITASHDPISRQKNNNEEKSKEKDRRTKKRHHQEEPAQKPSLGQKMSTSRNGISIETTGVSVRKELSSQKSIPRSQHINSSVSGRASETSLALSDQCRKKQTQSSQLRDAVFAEWLEEKGSHMKKERQIAALKKQQQEQEKAEKKAAREARVTNTVQKWMDSKSTHLKEVRQQQRKEEESKKQQEEERMEREKASEESAKKWREEQTKKLMKEHRRRKKEEEEKERAEREEAEEKSIGAKQAFKAWSEKKDEHRTQAARRLRMDERRKAQQKADDQETRVNEARNVYQAWKTEKDEKIKQTGSLYTYNKNPRQPPKNRWCPARNIKYPYSMTGSINDVKTLKSTSQVSTRLKKSPDPGDLSVTSSYSSCSFESEGSVREEASPKETAVEMSSRGEGGGEGERQTGRLKTVHVCCQTVEFWCTCDDENEEERVESN